MNVNLVIGIVLICLSTILSFIACIMYGWAQKDGTIDVIYSLWKVCVKAAGNEICDEIEDVSGEVEATRRLVVVAIIHAGISACFLLFFAFKTKMTGEYYSRSLLIGCFIAALISILLSVIACIVYGTTYKDEYGDGFELGAPFHMTHAAASCMLAGCINAMCSYRHSPRGRNDGRVVATATVMHNYPAGPQTGAPVVFATGGPPPYPGYGPPQGPPGYSTYGQQQATYPPAPYGSYPPQYNATPGGDNKGYDPAYPPPPPMNY